MSSLQVDSIATSSISANSIATNSIATNSIAAIGGGHVDGAGKVVQFKEAVLTTQTTVSNGATATIITLNFTPKFSDSLILCQAFHSHDACSGPAANFCNSILYAGTTQVGRADAVGYNTTKVGDARFQYSYSGSIASWGTTSLEIKVDVLAGNGNWTVSHEGRKTSLLVWEIAQ